MCWVERTKLDVKDFLHMTFYCVLKSHMVPAAPFAPHNEITIILNAKAREAKSSSHDMTSPTQPAGPTQHCTRDYLPLNFIMPSIVEDKQSRKFDCHATCFAAKKVHFVNLSLCIVWKYQLSLLSSAIRGKTHINEDCTSNILLFFGGVVGASFFVSLRVVKSRLSLTSYAWHEQKLNLFGHLSFGLLEQGHRATLYIQVDRLYMARSFSSPGWKVNVPSHLDPTLFLQVLIS